MIVEYREIEDGEDGTRTSYQVLEYMYDIVLEHWKTINDQPPKNGLELLKSL